jgi:hypothetical protein
MATVSLPQSRIPPQVEVLGRLGGSVCPRPTLRRVSDWQPAITGIAGLLGAAIGGGISLLTQRADRKERARGERAAAVVAFGYALDSLHTELSRIPRPTRLARLTDHAINEQRFPNLNRLLLWANSKTIGRDAERALDRLMSAANRLMVWLRSSCSRSSSGPISCCSARTSATMRGNSDGGRCARSSPSNHGSLSARE